MALLAADAAANAQPVNTQSVDSWRVDGAISGRKFALDCRFEQAAGVCVDAESRGKRSHPLLSLSSSASQKRWSFKTRVALLSITLAFDGRVDGDRMSGVVTAAGRTGSFTAVRR
ncbi:MAG: hypothetical protein WCY29_09170 [Novosphingobium sp.]